MSPRERRLASTRSARGHSTPCECGGFLVWQEEDEREDGAGGREVAWCSMQHNPPPDCEAFARRLLRGPLFMAVKP